MRIVVGKTTDGLRTLAIMSMERGFSTGCGRERMDQAESDIG